MTTSSGERGAPVTGTSRVPGPLPVDAASVGEPACPPADRADVGRALGWARSFPTAPDPRIGRAGPVCPRFPQSLDHRSLFVTSRPERDCADGSLRAAVREYTTRFGELQETVPEGIRNLVAAPIVLPRVDRSTPAGGA